jgi:acyl-CoA thioesterase
VTKFDADTALRRIDDGRFEGAVSPDWAIIIGANGGHLAAMVLRAMQMSVDDSKLEPRSLTVHFARAPKDETFEITTSIERTGRTMSNVSARMTQGGKLVVLGIGILSAPRTGPEFSDISMPDVPGPDASESVADRMDFAFGRNFDFRIAYGSPNEGSSDRAELGVWMRLREPRVVDHLAATQLLDAFAPAVFARLGRGGGGKAVPTIEMTYHYRESLPLAAGEAGAWHLGIFRTQTARQGFIEEDGWLWTADGVLLAQSRQLALLPDLS